MGTPIPSTRPGRRIQHRPGTKKEGETNLRNNSLLSTLSVPYAPYAPLPHARHVDGPRNTLELLDVHRVLLRKLSEGSVATAATKYLVLALFEERDEG